MSQAVVSAIRMPVVTKPLSGPLKMSAAKDASLELYLTSARPLAKLIYPRDDERGTVERL